MLNLAICDDIVEIASQLENMIIEIANEYLVNISIDIFYSGDKLLEYINNGSSYDLIFLDIEMEDINGIEVGKEIIQCIKDDKTQIAYISGMTKYAMELFQIRPINFLTKPLSRNKIEEVLQTNFVFTGCNSRLHSLNLFFNFSRRKRPCVSLLQ